jgi:hypothetical protein
MTGHCGGMKMLIGFDYTMSLNQLQWLSVNDKRE